MAEANIGIGSLINNRYQIQEILGQGGFGRTYLAFDVERFDEQCVLKEFVPTHTKRYAVQKARELFEREARILYKINHPQIPKFLAWFESAESLFIVQEYIRGKTYFKLLTDRLADECQPFSQVEVSQWLQNLLPVLEYLHGNDIVHRDISPDNIMLPEGQWQPILIDFGLVKQRVSQIWEMTSGHLGSSSEVSFVGKFGYSPPEQIRMGQCYPCSDLYSLAVTAIVLLTGKEPGVLMNRSLEWQWRSHVEIDDDLAEILDKMLSERPGDRYQSASEILALLQPASTTLSENELSLILEIEIDETNKNLQIAEIEETDYFKQLQAEAEFLRNDLYADSESSSIGEREVPLLSPEATDSELFEFFQPDMQPEVAFLQLDADFLDRCQQILSRYIGVMATCVLEDTIADNPGFSKAQLIAALAAEIPNAQQAAEFKQRLAVELDARLVPVLSTAAPERAESAVLETFPPESQAESSVQLDATFLNHCQQVLSRYIGVMAKCILEDTIADNPGFSEEQLIAALAAEIPHPQQAAEFRKSLVIEREGTSSREIPQKSRHTDREVGNRPPATKIKSGLVAKPESSFQLTQSVADRCQQELTRCIGPMAKYIVEDTLDQNPHLSVHQLIDRLAAEIPNPQRASEFRQRLLLSLGT